MNPFQILGSYSYSLKKFAFTDCHGKVLQNIVTNLDLNEIPDKPSISGNQEYLMKLTQKGPSGGIMFIISQARVIH